MPVLVIMIGIQGSCKTTFCKERFPGYEHISLDDLHTRNKERIVYRSVLEKHLDIVVDNTNPTIADRIKYMEPAKANGYKTVGYFMQSRVGDCIERNLLRTGKAKVPNTAIAATSNRLEMPSYDEGFDELYFVSILPEGFSISEWREQK